LSTVSTRILWASRFLRQTRAAGSGEAALD
jgi:hypothetical protein